MASIRKKGRTALKCVSKLAAFQKVKRLQLFSSAEHGRVVLRLSCQIRSSSPIIQMGYQYYQRLPKL